MATASRKPPFVKNGNPEHYFVIGASGQSIHLKGPFVDRDAAKAFVAKHRTHAPCWLMPAEYFGVVKHAPLDGDGQPVKEG